MNLISGTHHSCERREYAFMVLQEYIIIFLPYIFLNPKKKKKLYGWFSLSTTCLFLFIFIRFSLYLLHGFSTSTAKSPTTKKKKKNLTCSPVELKQWLLLRFYFSIHCLICSLVMLDWLESPVIVIERWPLNFFKELNISL